MPVLIVLAAILLLVTALVVLHRVDGARRLPAWVETVSEAHDKIRAGQAAHWPTC